MLLAEANLKAVDSQQRLIADVNDIEAANAEALALNQRITQVLMTTLDAPDLKNDEDAWKTWWYDHLGYRYDPPPPVSLAVNASPQYEPPRIYSCFVAGTPVRSINGHRPIESVRVGDRLLTQDVTTGALSFQSVMVVHHNAPAETIRVALDNGETITASTYHRFWQIGKGWAMAKQLRTGDTLRTLGGIARVVSLEPGATVPVFNLDVAGTRTFFVGMKDALVHQISSAADAPEFIHGEERQPPNVEIKKRLLHTGPFPVGSSHRPKTLPREPRFPTAVRTRRERLQTTAWLSNGQARAACKAASITGPGLGVLPSGKRESRKAPRFRAGVYLTTTRCPTPTWNRSTPPSGKAWRHSSLTHLGSKPSTCLLDGGVVGPEPSRRGHQRTALRSSL